MVKVVESLGLSYEHFPDTNLCWIRPTTPPQGSTINFQNQMSYYCSISSLYEIWILHLTCRQANITTNFHTNRIKVCKELSFFITLKGNKCWATNEIHGGVHIKARTKCCGEKKEKKERIHNYIHFALHLNTPVWRQRASLLCGHTRQMKDMQIASLDSAIVLQIHQQLL